MILVKEAHENYLNYLNAFTFFSVSRLPAQLKPQHEGSLPFAPDVLASVSDFLSETAFGSVWQWGLTALGLCKKQIFLIENFNLADSLCVFLQ